MHRKDMVQKLECINPEINNWIKQIDFPLSERGSEVLLFCIEKVLSLCGGKKMTYDKESFRIS